jgi:hypothetical protein
VTSTSKIAVTVKRGSSGPEFVPAELTVIAGTFMLWRDKTAEEQRIEPFKGVLLAAGGTRLTLARRPGTYTFKLPANPSARLEVLVI